MGAKTLFSGVTPLTGVGCNYIASSSEDSRVAFDQSILNLFIWLGFPLGIAVLVLLGSWLLTALRSLSRQDSVLYAGVAAFLISSLVMAMTDNLFFYPPYLLVVIPILSYAYWIRHLSAESVFPHQQIGH
jgi:hypothetical protein